MEFSAKQIAQFLQGEIVGNEEACVHTFAKIEEGVPGALSFLSNPKYTPYIYETKSSIVLVNKDFVPEKEVNATLIKVDNAYESLAKLLMLYEQSKPKKQGISPLASIATTAKIGENAYIGPFAVIGENVVIGANAQIYPHVYIGDGAKIGDDCLLYSSVNIYHGCQIGNRVTLHSGAIIGADGFGFAPQNDGNYKKIPQIGNVVIENNVEIGANTTIDRATMGSTIIHEGVKLDNLIQVGHNCEIGEHTVMAAQGGVAGSTKIGKGCMIGGQVGFAGHLSVADGTKVGAQAGIDSSLNDPTMYLGTPAMPLKSFYKSHIIFRRLPEMDKNVFELKRQVEELKKRLDEASK